ncbi:hypothetical protein [Gimesia maris]|uniref:hypothetical protein n=1 Tax=Gimesia maris TaxID=122 RepID=UPI0030D8B559|tara:strand:+ start:225640 stop:226026 length:387 start_codon:yes stop_codon:yes gene_type:complete
MSYRSYFLVVLAVLACVQTGCRTIPDYHQPAGFSSTYHQRIYPETAYASLADASTREKLKDPGVFYPTDVKVKQPKYVAPLAEIRDRITDEDLSNERKQLQLDSLKRTDNYINQEPIFNENFPAPGNW